MNVIFTAVMLALLGLSIPVITRPPPEPIEYNVSMCNKTMAISHLVLTTDKEDKETLTFKSYASAPGEMTDDKKPLVFPILVKEKLPDDDKILARGGATKLDNIPFILSFLTEGNRIVGVITANGNPILDIYGTIGKEAQVFDDEDNAKAFCKDLNDPQATDRNALKNWLEHGYVPLPTTK